MNEIKIIVTIDGPAGSGKTTVGRNLAAALNFTFIDTGILYRAVTWYGLKHKWSLSNEWTTEKLDKINWKWDSEKNTIKMPGLTRPHIQLTSKTILANIGTVSSMFNVREFINEFTRAIVKNNSSVVTGRDTGSIILPKADVKIYLDASLLIRAKRRHQEQLGKNKTLDEIEAELVHRDTNDRSRAIGRLVVPNGATVIRSDNLTVKQIINQIKNLITKKTEKIERNMIK